MRIAAVLRHWLTKCETVAVDSVLPSKVVNPNQRVMQADDVRAAVRVPFTQIVPTALSVIDTTNDSSSGAGCDLHCIVTCFVACMASC